ncbi:MAG: DUF983 domain-containing protein [Flavobacteriales bacterium]|jgi:hypothetical protein|nr:DUF983 domain-containing protein [Flavobacteriales bacterium]MCI1752414.1 DUF983 domain-containing protein [Flavobacteriales bacterium]
MDLKGTKLYSILNFKCPYCHEGQFFVAHPYNLRRAGDLLDKCPKCQRRYTIEPGFYYGAMYVSYAMTVAVAVSIWVAILVLNPEMDLDWQVGLIGAVMVLGAPLFYALSKITWANMFLEYKGPSSGTEEQRQPEG